MSVIINAGIPTKLIIEIPAKGDTNWTSKMRQAFQDIGDHDHTGVNGKGSQIGSAAIKDNAIGPQHLSNDINLPALSDVQLTYDPNNAQNPSLDGKLLSWSSSASQWVAIDPSATVSSVVEMDNVNTVHTFQNGNNIGSTLNINNVTAFASTGGVADFTYAIGGVASTSPNLSDLIIFSSVPLKVQNLTRVKIFTDSPVTITGDCNSCHIQSSSTVSVTGYVSKSYIMSANSTFANVSNSILQVVGTISANEITDCRAHASSTFNVTTSINNSDVKGGSITASSITDSSVQAHTSNITVSGDVVESNLKAPGTMKAKRYIECSVNCDTLEIDYSSYVVSDTISYDIHGCDIFVATSINVVGDSVNWNTAEFRGGIQESSIRAPKATLNFNGTVDIDDSTIDVYSIVHSAGGGSEYNDCKVRTIQFEVADSAVGLDSATSLDIAQWNTTTLGFNNISYGGNIQNKPVKIIDRKIQNCIARVFAGDTAKSYKNNGGGTTGNLGGGGTRNLLALNNYHNNLTYHTDSTHINLAPYWSDSDDGMKIRKSGWYELTCKVYIQVDATASNNTSVFNSARIWYERESGTFSGSTQAIGQYYQNFDFGEPNSDQAYTDYTSIARADAGFMRYTKSGDPVKMYFAKDDVVSLKCNFITGGAGQNYTAYAVYWWEIAMTDSTDNEDF